MTTHAAFLAFAWKSYALGFVSALLLIAAVLAAVRQIGGSFQSIRQRLRPTPPVRVKFKTLGGQLGSSMWEDGRRVWDNVRPDFAVRNDGPSALYDIEAGANDPRRTGERITYPVRAQRLAGEGSVLRFGEERFRIPAEWLDGYTGQSPHKQVVYFVEAADEAGRRWAASCAGDTGDDWVTLSFRRSR